MSMWSVLVDYKIFTDTLDGISFYCCRTFYTGGKSDRDPYGSGTPDSTTESSVYDCRVTDPPAHSLLDGR